MKKGKGGLPEIFVEVIYLKEQGEVEEVSARGGWVGGAQSFNLTCHLSRQRLQKFEYPKQLKPQQISPFSAFLVLRGKPLTVMDNTMRTLRPNLVFSSFLSVKGKHCPFFLRGGDNASYHRL